MPSFYCENCGREVPADVSSCPYCGRKFYSVVCPVCSFTGPASKFLNGCPSCGYQGRTDKMETDSTAFPDAGKHLPRWVYRVFFVVLLSALIVLVKIYLSL